MGRAALPSPECSDGRGGANTGVMVIVCGKIQGDTGEAFVELWGGIMGRKTHRMQTKSKMQRVQGSLGGILEEIGFASQQVFQI